MDWFADALGKLAGGPAEWVFRSLAARDGIVKVSLGGR
jgi:hypothetical protein